MTPGGLSVIALRRYGVAMNSTTTSTPDQTAGHTPVRLRANPLALPNILTYGRIVAVPLVVGCLFWQNILHGGLWLRWLALAIFVAAGVSDFLDGYIARIWAQQSSLGRMLDPIADKLLVASCLLMLGAEKTIHGWSLLAAIVILCRGDKIVPGVTETGIALLWFSALLTLYTGWDYLHAGLHHLTREDV